MADKYTLLIIDDDPEFFKTASLVLSDRFHCRGALSGEEALGEELSGVDAVLLDIELGHGMDGYQVLEILRQGHPDLPVIMISRREDIGSVVQAMRLGACDYVGKHFNLFELAVKVERALRHKRIEAENRLLREEAHERQGRLMGESREMQAIRDAVRRAASVASPVLISGESGTGKELVARDIHDMSARAGAPFVPVNCAAIPATLFESLLFGHERGAFTGADRRRIGRCEAAGEGTLLLDEVAEMPLATQSKFLRVLQEREFERLGSTRPIPMRARILASTNRDLEDMVEREAFRSDLFFRLNVLRIRIAPLRERMEDLDALVPEILARKAAEMKRRPPRVSERCLQCLHGWHWPGNVRELENVLESGLVHSTGDLLEPEDLPEFGRGRAPQQDFAAARKEAVERFERQYVRSALRAAGGNVAETARRMGMTRFGLQKMLKRIGIEAPDFRGGGGAEG